MHVGERAPSRAGPRPSSRCGCGPCPARIAYRRWRVFVHFRQSSRPACPDKARCFPQLETDADAGDAEEPPRQAKNWLDVGDNVPEAERARRRWATFRIESIEHATADAAYEGRRVKASELSPDGGATAESADAGEGGAAPGEIRRPGWCS